MATREEANIHRLPAIGDPTERKAENRPHQRAWQRALSAFVTYTTLTVAVAPGALYLLVSSGT